jgi:EAL domain-containing protein (putative c-di-GMP-specific phosphodiesterase class I)
MASDDPPPPSTCAESGTFTAVRHRGRVLVVDDHEELLLGCAELLEALGWEVVTAPDGPKAVAEVRSRGFDVVVSDISMPGMNGLQLLRAVREHDLDLPVVLMTGYPELRTAIEAVEQGANRYLVKPFGMQDLERAVEQAARLHQLARLKREALTELGLEAALFGDRAGLEASFARALHGLWMAFQPIVRSADDRIVGYEALVRTEERAIPHPGALFAASERLNRLLELGRAIRGSVAGIIDQAPAELNFFVNLHARELTDETLFAPDAPLTRHAHRVVLEITERASIESFGDVRFRVLELKRMGFRVAVDDLGSGYAGLNSLAHLEPEVVKIDMTLVRNVHREPVKRRLIASITSLCRDMGAQVVAEGVETDDERRAVTELGCELLQGYLIGRPGRLTPVGAEAPA